MHALEQTLEWAKLWLEIEKRDRRDGNGNMEKRMWNEMAWAGGREGEGVRTRAAVQAAMMGEMAED